MDSSNSKRRIHYYQSLRRRLTILFAMVLGSIACEGYAQETDFPTVLVTTPFIQRHYRLPDENRPRLGILVSPEDIESGSGNFRLCDGIVIQVEVSSLVVSKKTCEGKKSGPIAMASPRSTASMEILVGSSVYDPKGLLIGKIESVGELENGDKPNHHSVPKLFVKFNSDDSRIEYHANDPAFDLQISSNGAFTGVVRAHE